MGGKYNNDEKIDIATDYRFQMERIITLLNLRKAFTRIPKNGELLYRCPLCGDSKDPNHGHLYINLKTNSYSCSHCGEKGKALSLYAKVNGISNKEAFKQLLGKNTSKKENKRIYQLKNIKKHIDTNKEENTVMLAGIKRRDAVYKALLKELELTPEHMYDLLKRGLSKQFIEGMQYKSIPQNSNLREEITYKLIKKGYKLTGIPGFYKKNDYWTFSGYKGYLVPALDNENRIQAFQVNRMTKKNKYIWFSSSGEKEGTPVTTFINITSYNKNKPFVIVEGTLKSQVCSFLKPSANYIGIPGTFSVKHLISVLKKLKINSVFTAFDMDKLKNPLVKKAESNLIMLLTKEKINYKIFNWPLEQGKGLDDYIFNIMLQKSTQAGGFKYYE